MEVYFEWVGVGGHFLWMGGRVGVSGGIFWVNEGDEDLWLGGSGLWWLKVCFGWLEISSYF